MTDKPKILKYFEYNHLPPALQSMSAPFHKLAHDMVDMLPENVDHDQVSSGLYLLLTAKDCFVRARLP